MREVLYRCRFYYGGNVEPPKAPWSLAIETVHASRASKDMEVLAGKSRLDIGSIEVFSRDGDLVQVWP